PRGGKDGRRIEGRHELGLAVVRCRLPGEARECLRTGVDVASRAGRDEIELARCPVSTPMELATQNEPGSEAGPDPENHEIIAPARDSEPVLPERGEVDVVLDAPPRREGPFRLHAEAHLLQPGHARHVHLAGVRIYHSGNADDGTVDEVVADACSRDERVAES